MMNERGAQGFAPDQLSGSRHTFGTTRHPFLTDLCPSKRVCFYKSGDPQFSGLRMVINNRTFKTFDALLDSLSKKVPLPFGVRNITTPRGVHPVHTLDELEDGKSYICSDSRKVKPINLALARRKMPPWYHARPVTARRQAVQLARLHAGRAAHKHEPVVVRTPKKLTVFRNGDPAVKYTVILQKRTTPTFESLLEYMTELMQFHVVKLYTPDGRRVDGLPALILCSGAVVAAGREPFKYASYNTQKSPSSTRLSSRRMGPRRLKAMHRKKKSISHISKSRNFSLSSERYIVNRIQNSITGSLCDFPSNPTDSMELEPGRTLESVAQTERDTCLGYGTEGQEGFLPTDDDIEKSFRVNQDGSMTVEMRVRLTIKEEETVHWTTTLSRTSVANQFNTTYLPDPEPQLEQNSSLNSSPVDSQNPTPSTDSMHWKKPKDDDDDDDPPSLDNGVVSENGDEGDNVKVQMDMASPRRAPTPGPRQVRRKQASVESITSVTAEEIQEGVVGSYMYREESESGAMTEQYCMVKQSSTRPVPKPRRMDSQDASSQTTRNLTTFTSTEVADILQFEESGEEVSETVLHIYEQQTCRDNFHANSHFLAQGVSMAGILYGRPATSDTARYSFNNDFESERGRPSTASESVSIWRAESMSVTSDLTVPSVNTGADCMSPHIQKQHFPEPTTGKDSSQLLSASGKVTQQQRVANKSKRTYSKPKVLTKHAPRIMSPGKRQKENIAEAPENHKRAKTFSSAGFIKRIYGYKPKPVKSMIKLKKKATKNEDGGVTTTSADMTDGTVTCAIKDPNISSPEKENTSETISFEKSRLDVPPTEISQPRGILTRQESMHLERKSEKEPYDVSESMSLPAFNSSTSVINEYVENWLEKAHLNPTVYPDEQSQKVEALPRAGTESGMSGKSETNDDVITVTEKVGCLEEKTETQACPGSKTVQSPDSFLETKVKQRIQSFESKSFSSSSSSEKTTVIKQTLHTRITNTKCNSLPQNNIEEINPQATNISAETNTPPIKTLTELSSDGEVDNKSTPVKISLQSVTPPSSLSVEKAPTPAESPVENTEIPNMEHCETDAPSMVSSPLYKISSVSSLASGNRPISISPTSDQATSPSDHILEKTTPNETDVSSTLREEPLTRNSSVKRARLVSNISFERKMSLKKASLDKSALGNEASLETRIPSMAINTAAENMPVNSVSSTGIQSHDTLPEKTPPSNSMLDLPSSCISASPSSLTSEERASSVSVSSNEASASPNLPLKDKKASKTSSHVPTQKEASSPKSPVKKVKLVSNPSQGSTSPSLARTSLPRNPSLKLASSHSPSLDKTISPTLGMRKTAASNSPTTERQSSASKALPQKRLSPYSQSLDVVSPPMRHKSNIKSLSRNLSLDNASEPINQTLKKSPSQKKRNQTPLPKKSPAKLPDTPSDQILACETLIQEQDRTKAAQEKPLTEAQIIPQPVKNANQPNMKPVLEKICYSIKSIRQITQSKRLSCLERSNSLPDFSSHVASTFGSSSKALLAFLSVMTLKEGINNLNMHELDANNVSCAEALKMIDSLREIASIEDSHKLNASLSNLQKSASKQLLQSWKGFQELSKSRSSTPNDSEQDLNEASLVEENVIDELMNELDIPEPLKEELAALPGGKGTESKQKETPTDQATIDSEGEEGHLPSEGTDRDVVNEENLRVAYMDVKDNTRENLEKDSDFSPVDESCSDQEGQEKQSDYECVEREASSDVNTTDAEEEKQSCSEQEEPEVERNEDASSNPPRQGSIEKRQKRQPANNFKPLKVINEESVTGSDIEDQSLSEEDRQKVPSKELHVIIEESISGIDEEHVSLGEEHTDDQQGQDERINTSEGDEDRLIDEAGNTRICGQTQTKSLNISGRLSNLTENQASYAIKDKSSVRSVSLEKNYSFDVDRDSGNDHRSCDEHDDEVEPPKAVDEHSSSGEDELSYERDSSSEGEHATTGRYTEECRAGYQVMDGMGKRSEEATTCEKAVRKLEDQSEEIKSQSVAERVILLEKQVADAQRNNTTGSLRVKQFPKKHESDIEDSTSESQPPRPGVCTKPAQSSLSFSYDSSGVITKEPEGNRVKSIKEMFLAKTAADIQSGQKRFTSPNTELSDYRPETSDSGGYQSQNSSELSSGEDNSPRKSIRKGFVRKTIEMLYGKKDASTDDVESQRPPSAPKQKKNESSGVFTPFQISGSKVMSDLSYFNSTNTLDTLSEAARCIAFNAQVRPEDSVPTEDERCFLRENSPMRKSKSDPAGINITCEKPPRHEGVCENTKEDVPYSLFSTKSDKSKDKEKLTKTKCTYFSLPHTSDSETCQDDVSVASKGSVNSDSMAERAEDPEETKMWAERNGTLPGAGIKMLDNKVHPLIEKPDGEVVVVQPGKNYGAVNRRIPEPDVLDILYTFCGQHCPIL